MDGSGSPAAAMTLNSSTRFDQSIRVANQWIHLQARCPTRRHVPAEAMKASAGAVCGWTMAFHPCASWNCFCSAGRPGINV